MVDNEVVQQAVEIVDLWNMLSDFFQQGFQILFDALLAMKANTIVDRFLTLSILPGHQEIFLGLPNPRSRRLFHRGPFRQP